MNMEWNDNHVEDVPNAEASSLRVRFSTLPRVVIVGRPNVGKSTLFNRLIGHRIAIVDDQPGVTRDRLYRPMTWSGKTFILTDTGGFFGPDEDPLSPNVQSAIEDALRVADVICMVTDGRDGPTGLDQNTADRIRRLRMKPNGTAIPVLLAVNKWDNTSEDFVSPFYELGFDTIFPVSALHGHGTGNLLDAFIERLPESEALDESELDIPGIALLGRPNVGKSTFLNSLSGEQRSIVSPLPGTTRDPVDTLIEWSNATGETKFFRLVDTAGVRRRGKMSVGLDRYSMQRCQAALARSELALMMIDGTEGPTESDAKVFSLAHDLGRAGIILVNKWDDVSKDTNTAGAMVKEIRERMPFLRYAEVIFISALTGQRLHRVMPSVERALEQYRRRIPTAELNSLLEDILRKTPPPSRHGRMSRIYYWTQVSVAPPTFVVFANDADRIHFSYQRFLINRLYESFGFDGTPIRLFVRGRRKTDRGPKTTDRDERVVQSNHKEAEAIDVNGPDEAWEDPS